MTIMSSLGSEYEEFNYGPDEFVDYDNYWNEEDWDDDMDGDLESGLASAGFGTDEDYEHYFDE